ncbi:MAG: hypothetical protein EOO10_24655 [Chitinophagaceae bacterium]|nr:MAG: hypothetical protein EOO10_24655 [Chitinophagaceae bacterium]
MKKISTILLLVTIFLQTFSAFVIQAEYFLNKDYIAKVLCINKAKPKMHCNGKCYLTKKLRDVEDQNQQAPTPKKDKFDVQPYFLPDQVCLTATEPAINVEYWETDELFHSTFLHAVFHPPTV